MILLARDALRSGDEVAQFLCSLKSRSVFICVLIAGGTEGPKTSKRGPDGAVVPWIVYSSFELSLQKNYVHAAYSCVHVYPDGEALWRRNA